MTPELRPYQVDFVQRLRQAFVGNRSVLGVAPTGSGKTVMFCSITAGAADRGNNIIIAAHRQEICNQISAALRNFGVHHGVIQSGRGMVPANCHVAMIQTLSRRAGRIPPPKLLVVDEAHHAVSPTYARLIEAWPDTKILGVTATPARLDGMGLGKWFQKMIVGPSTAELIDAGYLANFKYLAPPSKMDLSKVRTSMGEFNVSDAEAVVTATGAMGDVVEHYRTYLHGRPAVAFCVTVRHAEMIAEEFRAAGYRAASVDGTMTDASRYDIIQSIGDGRLDVLASCELISEGVDIPVVSGALLCRPTQSLAVFLQQCGRVLRLKPDGSDAVILDHVGNVTRHGVPHAEREWTLDGKQKKSEFSARVCGICYRVFDAKEKNECEGIPVPAVYDPVPDASWSPDGCLFWLHPAEDAPEKSIPEMKDGDLEIVDTMPEWADGLDLASAKLSDILSVAKTKLQLIEVARIRGYKMRWVEHVMGGAKRRDHQLQRRVDAQAEAYGRN